MVTTSSHEQRLLQRREGVQAIRTEYAGVQFRSRLEAKWAAFFDLLEWPWEYEPIDLAGYIPDFIMPFRHSPLLVEVKPSLTPADMHEHKDKLMLSAWNGEAMIVGARLGHLCAGDYLCGIFAARDMIDGGLEWRWDDARLMWCVACRGITVCESNGSWACRRCGVDDSSHRGLVPEGHVNNLWSEAGNRVQWRKSK